MPDLSSAQFGQQRPLGEWTPPVHVMQTGRSNPMYEQDYEPPLSIAAGRFTGPERAAAWRPPRHLLGYQQATSSSVFDPYGNNRPKTPTFGN